MQIWVDADACPVPIREILFRAAERTGLNLTLVANHPLRSPPLKTIRVLQVGSGFDKADEEIVQRMSEGDLVITSDLPLSAEILERGGQVLSPRGERLTRENIGARLNMRDFMESMRSSGIQTGGSPALDASDRKRFADQLDRLLSAHRGKYE